MRTFCTPAARAERRRVPGAAQVSANGGVLLRRATWNERDGGGTVPFVARRGDPWTRAARETAAFAPRAREEPGGQEAAADLRPLGQPGSRPHTSGIRPHAKPCPFGRKVFPPCPALRNPSHYAPWLSTLPAASSMKSYASMGMDVASPRISFTSTRLESAPTAAPSSTRRTTRTTPSRPRSSPLAGA